MKCITLGGRPHLCLFATEIIQANSEIRYNYDEEGKENLWWRREVTHSQIFNFIKLIVQYVMDSVFQKKLCLGFKSNFIFSKFLQY